MITNNVYVSALILLAFLLSGGCVREEELEGKNPTIYEAFFAEATAGGSVQILDMEAVFRLSYYQPADSDDFVKVTFDGSRDRDVDPHPDVFQCPAEDPECDIVARYIVIPGVIETPIKTGSQEFTVTVDSYVAEGVFHIQANAIGYKAVFSRDLTSVEVSTWVALTGGKLIEVKVDHVRGRLPIFDSTQAPP